MGLKSGSRVDGYTFQDKWTGIRARHIAGMKISRICDVLSKDRCRVYRAAIPASSLTRRLPISLRGEDREDRRDFFKIQRYPEEKMVLSSGGEGGRERNRKIGSEREKEGNSE